MINPIKSIESKLCSGGNLCSCYNSDKRILFAPAPDEKTCTWWACNVWASSSTCNGYYYMWKSNKYKACPEQHNRHITSIASQQPGRIS